MLLIKKYVIFFFYKFSNLISKCWFWHLSRSSNQFQFSAHIPSSPTLSLQFSKVRKSNFWYIYIFLFQVIMIHCEIFKLRLFLYNRYVINLLSFCLFFFIYNNSSNPNHLIQMFFFLICTNLYFMYLTSQYFSKYFSI